MEEKNSYKHRYLPSHPRRTKESPYVGRHVLAMEEYLSILFDEEVFIPKDWHVHHINGIRDDNALINLQLVTRAEHNHIHKKNNKYNYNKHQDTSDRVCFLCKSKNTSIVLDRKRNQTPYPRWQHLPTDQVNWYCFKCYKKHWKGRKRH